MEDTLIILCKQLQKVAIKKFYGLLNRPYSRMYFYPGVINLVESFLQTTHLSSISWQFHFFTLKVYGRRLLRESCLKNFVCYFILIFVLYFVSKYTMYLITATLNLRKATSEEFFKFDFKPHLKIFRKCYWNEIFHKIKFRLYTSLNCCFKFSLKILAFIFNYSKQNQFVPIKCNRLNGNLRGLCLKTNADNKKKKKQNCQKYPWKVIALLSCSSFNFHFSTLAIENVFPSVFAALLKFGKNISIESISIIPRQNSRLRTKTILTENTENL